MLNDKNERLDDKNKRAVEKSGRLSYHVGFSVAYGRELSRRGAEDGTEAAKTVAVEPPDETDLQRAQREYESSFLASVSAVFKKRGEADGAAFARKLLGEEPTSADG